MYVYLLHLCMRVAYYVPYPALSWSRTKTLMFSLCLSTSFNPHTVSALIPTLTFIFALFASSSIIILFIGKSWERVNLKIIATNSWVSSSLSETSCPHLILRTQTNFPQESSTKSNFLLTELRTKWSTVKKSSCQHLNGSQ